MLWAMVDIGHASAAVVEVSAWYNYSVAEVQFSPVLPPFFENREPNRQIFFRTE